MTLSGNIASLLLPAPLHTDAFQVRLSNDCFANTGNSLVQGESRIRYFVLGQGLLVSLEPSINELDIYSRLSKRAQQATKHGIN